MAARISPMPCPHPIMSTFGALPSHHCMTTAHGLMPTCHVSACRTHMSRPHVVPACRARMSCPHVGTTCWDNMPCPHAEMQDPHNRMAACIMMKSVPSCDEATMYLHSDSAMPPCSHVTPCAMSPHMHGMLTCCSHRIRSFRVHIMWGGEQ